MRRDCVAPVLDGGIIHDGGNVAGLSSWGFLGGVWYREYTGVSRVGEGVMARRIACSSWSQC